MFFSDKTSSAALTVLFAETEKKPACFFTSSNCFAVFLGLSIAISPPLFTSTRGLQAGATRSPPMRRRARSGEYCKLARRLHRYPPEATAASFAFLSALATGNCTASACQRHEFQI